MPTITARYLLLIGLVLTAASLAVVARADEIVVSAAASLTDSFNEIGSAFTKASPGTTVRFNFGASGALKQQIENGAPVDVFASASPKEIEELKVAKRLEPSSAIVFATNSLVLIVPARGRIRNWEELARSVARRVAISNPDSVPSGRYARETLIHRGLWVAVEPKIVMCENVRQTLAYVASGDVDAGLVFATDAEIDRRRVRVVQTAMAADHSPIVYPAAVVSSSRNAPAARRFVNFLRSSTARTILTRFGFSSPPRPEK